MLVGSLVWCGDPECDCWVAIINDLTDGESKEIWRSSRLEHPSENQKTVLYGQLVTKCRELGARVLPNQVYDGS